MKKSHRIISSLFVVAASLGSVVGAQAQDNRSGASSRSGMYGAGKSYIGLNAGQSNFSLGDGTGLFGSDSRDTAYSLYAGNYFNNNFGLEFGYTDFGRVNRAGGSTRADGIGMSLVGKLPLGDAFNLLGRIGTIYGRTNVASQAGSGIVAGDESGFGLSLGVGAEYMFNPQWSAVLQYDAHDLNFIGGSRERISITTLGMRYRF
ncbi:outer membrane beta-barrel protein [Rhodoferax sp. UBA5149]|uniref:outer membrane beta-barrel protein n=1 Tax=Rhodoferax sp. UBA5149 TaxID=1947379 RepID=UPI0025D3FAEC|nr:outer membrane beta-barrel protein [Rhodoferax sp. UBA5149]